MEKHKDREEIEDEEKSETKNKSPFEGVVLKVGSEYLITCDSRSFTLKPKGAPVGYYPTIGSCFDYIFELESKRNFAKAKEKDILSVMKSIEKAEKYMSEIVRPLLNCEAYKHLKKKWPAETEVDEY
jgi:hypothetical protein